MKKKILFFIFVMLIMTILNAQIPEFSIWSNIRNSSYTENDELHIRCETVDLPGLETNIYFTTDSGWESDEMVNLSGLTYESVIPATPEETQFCRFRTVTDTLVGMMPAFLPDDSFPPAENELSFVAADAVGDTLGTVPENLDITGYDFGYSDSRFYTSIENANGQFPTNNGTYPMEFYFYVTTLLNPENVLLDSTMYAMIYSQYIPGLLSSGLYRISGTEFSLDSFVQIGSIETEVSDGKLVMACDIEDLTEDEFFGEWPNLSNSIGAAVTTAKFALPSEMILADISKSSLQFIQNYEIAAFTNSLPEIDNVECNLEVATTNVTLEYSDFDHNFPLTAEIIVDDEVYQFIPLSFDYSQPVIFEAIFSVTDWEEAVIRISDNNYEFVEETICPTSSPQNEIIDAKVQLSNYPNPFNPETTIYFGTTNSHEETRIEIYNLKGQKVKILECVNRVDAKATGSLSHSIIWNGTDQNNQPVSSGVYFYKLFIDEKTVASKKCLLLK